MVDVSNIFYPTLTLPLQRGGNWIFIVSPLYKGKGGWQCDENYGIPLFKHPLKPKLKFSAVFVMNIIYRYSFSEILEIIQQQVYLTKGCYLTIQEQEILKGTWNNLSHREIAESLYLSNGYVRIIASALWKTLSSVFGENITKANFYYTINNILQLDNTDNNNDHRNQYPKEHILIVDDSLEIIQLISRFLNKNGYRVSAFMNGNDALMFLKNQSI
jgi:hypothetical protein